MDGVHVSASGGLTEAVRRVGEYGASAAQVFLRSPRTYFRSRPVSDEEIAAVRGLVDSGVPVVSHAPYVCVITNPPDDPRTVAALKCIRDEIEDATALGVQAVVVHPGSMVDEEDRENAILNLRSLRQFMYDHTKVELLLENSASLNALHSDIEFLRDLINEAQVPDLGMCLDVAHLIVSGHSKVPQRHRRMIRVVHFNNPTHDIGSGRDGHGALGEGLFPLGTMEKWYKHLRSFLPHAPFIVEGGSKEDVANMHQWRAEM